MTMSAPVSTRRGAYHDGLRRCRPRRGSRFAAVDGVADRTILVAEDDANCRRALQHYLKRSGYHGHRGRQRDRLARGGRQRPGRPGHPRPRPGWRDLRGPDQDPAPQHRAASSSARAGPPSATGSACSTSAPTTSCQAVLLRRARGPGAGRPPARQRHTDDDPRPRRPRHRPGHPDGDRPRGRGRDDPQGVRPARLPRRRAGTGLLPRGPARAGLGLQRAVAGPLDGHRAHPPGPAQKIEADPENPRWITTIRGIGYRFSSPAA